MHCWLIFRVFKIAIGACCELRNKVPRHIQAAPDDSSTVALHENDTDSDPSRVSVSHLSAPGPGIRNTPLCHKLASADSLAAQTPWSILLYNNVCIWLSVVISNNISLQHIPIAITMPISLTIPLMTSFPNILPIHIILFCLSILYGVSLWLLLRIPV